MEDYYLLLAERDGERVHPAGDCASYFDTLEAAAETVERWEDNGRWPEGYEAVATKGDETWLYADGWERVAS